MRKSRMAQSLQLNEKMNDMMDIKMDGRYLVEQFGWLIWLSVCMASRYYFR